MARRGAFVGRILTLRETDYCLSRSRPHEAVAGRWAVKEAIAKALGRALSWHDVEVLPDSFGRPVAYLSGSALEAAEGGTVHVSISHTEALASAVAVWSVEGPSA